jgi:hypothetical protein
MINYEAQFKSIDRSTADEISAGFKRVRTYVSAKAAFTSAQRSEARGTDVAFAEVGGLYIVWTVAA